MNGEISKELQLVLSKLCSELHLFLNKTESSLFLAQTKFKQVDNILKPWEMSDNFDLEQEKCICKTSNLQRSEINEDSDLLNTISRTLNSAELIRRKSLKSNVPLNKISLETNSVVKNLRKSSENIIKSKPKVSQTVKKCISVQSTSTLNDKHSPCCPLYKTRNELIAKQSFLKLSDAITFHKIPSVLTQTIKHSNKILSCSGKSTSSYKNIFFQNLDAQIDEYCLVQQEKNSSIKTFLIYLSSLSSYEKKRKGVIWDTWIFYKNEQSLEIFHSSRLHIITKESWIIILNFITNEFIPVLQKCTQDRKQKLHLFKILKTICNFVYSNIPSIPIFKVQTQSIGLKSKNVATLSVDKTFANDDCIRDVKNNEPFLIETWCVTDYYYPS